MKGKMTTSRMGIMGSFLDSNFSLDVVTESPWVTNNGDDQRVSNGPSQPTRFYADFTVCDMAFISAAFRLQFPATWPTGAGDGASGVLKK